MINNKTDLKIKYISKWKIIAIVDQDKKDYQNGVMEKEK
jgi:hypothetical protein